MTVSAVCILVELLLAAHHYKEFLPRWFVDGDPQRWMVMLLAALLIWIVVASSEEKSSGKTDQASEPVKAESSATGNVGNIVHVYPPPSLEPPVQKPVSGMVHVRVKRKMPNIKVVHRKVTTINEPYPGVLNEKDGKGEGFYKGFIISFRNEKNGTEDFEVIDWYSVRARIRFVDVHGEEKQHTSSGTFVDETTWETTFKMFEVRKLLIAMKIPNGKWITAESGDPVELPAIPLKAEVTLYGVSDYIYSASVDMDLEQESFRYENTPESQSQVSEADPRIYVSLKKCGEVENHPLESRLVLFNGGKEPAHGVSVDDLSLRVGNVTFDGPIGLIAANATEEIVPRTTIFGPAFSRDITRVLMKEFETYPNQLEREKITVPVTVKYTDYRGTRFETDCDLIFNGIANALKNLVTDRQIVEFHNFRFRKIQS